ncbi:MAG: molybdopterin converting factor subunit 1 [Aestuariivita sp.]|nr:molybdopterin converting factor subunit 1 [Aestuariivita sp.]MCY4202923.1 molybdopterin converting factor subunit 1 [Aestuariivita sp.]MCY4288018.1 molybdopterin converting factor subunit 1 [Aestuariivita sp.]MCY4346615.1 molybdopterin converting factor subunit 1 [Aestuariivita sp.]
MQILYFAWVRERIGVPKDVLATEANTVSELVEELKGRAERYQIAFSDMSSIRVAVDQELAELNTPLAGAQEVAFFPPMTGG